ncbi:MAG: hypothetical protein LH606_04270 [Cytophagaceae bacterium]|nr:hypothetical protein [Cytophagaceae bacterium]
MTITLLEYIKVILKKVSFDAKLFEKELKKAIRMLVAEDITQLKLWCYNQFGSVYRRILRRCFAGMNFRRFKSVVSVG